MRGTVRPVPQPPPRVFRRGQRDKHRNLRWICFLICLPLLFLASCSPPSDPLAYREQALCVRLEGNRGSDPFCCRLTSAEGKLAELVYLAPPALEGLRITPDPSSDQTYIAELHGIRHVLSASAIEGLLAPAYLFLLPNATLQATQQLDNNTSLITLSCNHAASTVTLTLQNGLPTTITDGWLTVAVGKDLGEGETKRLASVAVSPPGFVENLS